MAATNPALRTAQDLHRAAAVDRRRDLLPADRSHFPRRLSPTNKHESGALSALFAIGQWRVSSRLYCRQTRGMVGVDPAMRSLDVSSFGENGHARDWEQHERPGS